MTALILSLFLTGFLGSTHCLFMCGGISVALGLGAEGLQARRRWALAAAYQIGRLLSYASLGALGGLLASAVTPLPGALKALQILGALLMLMLALYLSGLWNVLAPLERLGARLWRHIEPFGRRLLPVSSLPRALSLGYIWGWLPCGMVYSAFALALTAATPWHSALSMLAFGLGTLPAMFAASMSAASLRNLVQRRWLQRAAALLIGVIALMMLAKALGGAPMQHHAAPMPPHAQHQHH